LILLAFSLLSAIPKRFQKFRPFQNLGWPFCLVTAEAPVEERGVGDKNNFKAGEQELGA
jgi:hypothetical protein